MATNSLIEELKKEILDFDARAKEETLGEVAEIGDGIAKIYGLRDAKSGELLTIESKNGPLTAMALNLEETSIGRIVLGEYRHIEAGDKVKTTGQIASVNVGADIIGRVVNPLGVALDGKGPVSVWRPSQDGPVSANAKGVRRMPIEKIAPGVITRQGVTVPLQTGIKAIDALIPIGRGQRELIIGDRGTGKTTIAIDTIV